VPFFDPSALPPFEPFPGCRLRTPFGERLMLSYVELDAGAEVPLHHHPHEQGGVVLSGRLELTIGAETRVLDPGQLYLVPPDVPHRARAVGGPCVVLDVFTPVREDYAAAGNKYVPRPTD
jgi:quercetin dioxygenase-like cupin family protein